MYHVPPLLVRRRPRRQTHQESIGERTLEAAVNKAGPPRTNPRADGWLVGWLAIGTLRHLQNMPLEKGRCRVRMGTGVHL